MLTWLTAVLTALAIPTVAGAELRLALPLACDLGVDCYIQQFVDRDPGPGATDFTCGPLSYDGHKGTDFALPALTDLDRDVRVLAAAPGIVAGLRDGMPDVLQNGSGPDVTGQECGNGVVIDHGDGWQTQYCHLAQGSILVQTGDVVDAGAALGTVGLSGQTQFPHLHLSVRQNGAVIDPFDPAGTLTCGTPPTETLWDTAPAYTPGGLLQAGLATGVPEFEAIKAGLPPATLSATAPLVLWGHMFGGREGDILRLTITGPAGEVITHNDTLTRTQAQLFRAAGRRAPDGGWPPGDYNAQVDLIRGETIIDTLQTSGTIN